MRMWKTKLCFKRYFILAEIENGIKDWNFDTVNNLVILELCIFTLFNGKKKSQKSPLGRKL